MPQSQDASVLAHIQKLVAEEHKLFEGKALSPEQDKRLGQLQTELDQCWDLLRQRRALREYGRNPDEADVRPASIVENYRG